MSMENIPSENPRTGRITALSVIAALRKLTAPLRWVLGVMVRALPAQAVGCSGMAEGSVCSKVPPGSLLERQSRADSV